MKGNNTETLGFYCRSFLASHLSQLKQGMVHFKPNLEVEWSLSGERILDLTFSVIDVVHSGCSLFHGLHRRGGSPARHRRGSPAGVRGFEQECQGFVHQKLQHWYEMEWLIFWHWNLASNLFYRSVDWLIDWQLKNGQILLFMYSRIFSLFFVRPAIDMIIRLIHWWKKWFEAGCVRSIDWLIDWWRDF